MRSSPCLSINPSLSPPSTTSSSSSSFPHSSAPIFLRFPSNQYSWPKPISLFAHKARLSYSESRKLEVRASNMTITEVGQEEEEEGPPPYVESESNSRPRRIALFVEPSPFAWVPQSLLHWLFFFIVKNWSWWIVWLLQFFEMPIFCKMVPWLFLVMGL